MKDHPRAYVDQTAKVNVPFRLLQGCIPTESRVLSQTSLPRQIYIGPYCVIGEHVTLGERVIIDSHCIVERDVIIGDDTLVIYRASIGGGAVVGKSCIIGGFVSENCRIGDRSRVFGSLVHAQRDTSVSWDHFETPEPPVILHEDTFVGFGAVVAGGLQVGPNSYVCAAAIVTRNVPPYHIASGVNNIIFFDKWEGPLRENPIFREGN